MLEIYTLVIEASVFTLLLKLSHRNNVIQKLRNQNKEMTDTVGPYIYSRNIDSVLDSFVQRQISCFLFIDNYFIMFSVQFGITYFVCKRD